MKMESCPFCGKTAGMEFQVTDFGVKLWYVSCSCGVNTIFCETEEQAAALWNRRPGFQGPGFQDRTDPKENRE